MRYYALIVSTLCVWRITHLLVAEDGPWDLVLHLRRAAGDGFFGKLLDCFKCLSLWIAVPFAFLLAESVLDLLLHWLALSAGAILLERVSASSPAAAIATYHEDEEG